jgi:PRTRC genetic system protein C
MTTPMNNETAAPQAIVRLPRKFKVGVTLLEDADPSKSPQESMALYVNSYPFLAHATLGEPEEQNGALVYPVHKPVVQTKGARRKKAEAVDAAVETILGWSSENTNVSDTEGWREVYNALTHITSAPATVVQSAYLPLV